MSSQVTVQDIAQKAGVDVRVVAQVMFQQDGVDRLLRNRVLWAMKELDYDFKPKQDWLDQKILGVIAAGFVNEYIDAVVSNLTEVTRAAQIGLKIYVPEDETLEGFSRFISDPRIFGVLLLSPHFYAKTLEACRHYEMPIASFSFEEGADLSEVLLLQIDNHKSIVSAVNHLVTLRHQRIGFITGYMQHNDAIERYEGYRAGLDKHHLPYDETLVYHGDFLEDSGFDAGLHLLQQDPRPSAIIASSDLMAIGAMRAAQTLGLKAAVDYSVIGFDDLPLAAQMSLTTLAPPYQTLGAAAIDGLQHMAAGEALPQYTVREEADFVFRTSTAACN